MNCYVGELNGKFHLQFYKMILLFHDTNGTYAMLAGSFDPSNATFRTDELCTFFRTTVCGVGKMMMMIRR